MSKFQMTVDIPVERHVKLYLAQNVMLKKPYILTSTSTIGSYLLKLIQPKSHSMPLRYRPEETISVLLSDNYNYICRPYISKDNAGKFNRFVERKIKEEMYVFVASLCDYSGREINDAIKEFMVRYGFTDDDLSFECLKQAYFRHRRALESLKQRAA